MQCTNLQNVKGVMRPCGKCLGCKISLTTDWTIRNCCEFAYYEHSAFVTLTYNDENLPDNYSLSKVELQNFFDNLQHKFKDYDGRKIRYYACGEYGDDTQRPHY